MSDDQCRNCGYGREVSIESAFKYLQAIGIFFYDDPSELEEGESTDFLRMVNLNDTFAWACADGEVVPDECMDEVARLHRTYGWGGILYWVSQRRGGMRAEFHDVTRHIDFVAQEERIRAGKSSSEYAYTKAVYTLGEPVASNG